MAGEWARVQVWKTMIVFVSWSSTITITIPPKRSRSWNFYTITITMTKILHHHDIDHSTTITITKNLHDPDNDHAKTITEIINDHDLKIKNFPRIKISKIQWGITIIFTKIFDDHDHKILYDHDHCPRSRSLKCYTITKTIIVFQLC